MFGAFAPGQGYFGQGPIGGTVPPATPPGLPVTFFYVPKAVRWFDGASARRWYQVLAARRWFKE